MGRCGSVSGSWVNLGRCPFWESRVAWSVELQQWVRNWTPGPHGVKQLLRQQSGVSNVW